MLTTLDTLKSLIQILNSAIYTKVSPTTDNGKLDIIQGLFTPIFIERLMKIGSVCKQFH